MGIELDFREACPRAPSNAVPAALAIFSGRAPADPMEVHDMLFATLGAKALHLGFIVVHHGIGLVV